MFSKKCLKLIYLRDIVCPVLSRDETNEKELNMKKNLAVLFCCCLSYGFLIAGDVTNHTAFFADEIQISIDEPEQYARQTAILRTFEKTKDENHIYFYRIKEIDVDNREVFLEDNSRWDIGWWYQDVIMNWQSGDRLMISHSYGWNGVGIQNLDKGSLAWASIWKWNFPTVENADYIVDIARDESHVVLTLKSGFQFSLPLYRFFNLSYEIGEGVFVFQNENAFSIRKLSCGCTKTATLVTIGNSDWRKEAQ